MGRMVETRELRTQDLFEMPHGSVYVVSDVPGQNGASPQARLLCAHPPDPITFEPRLIDVPLGEQVRLLSANDVQAHRTHEGNVEHVFRREMDRRHYAMMQVVGAKWQQEQAAEAQHARARRPWWRKLFG